MGRTGPTNYECKRHFLLYTTAEQWRICKKATEYSIKEMRLNNIKCDFLYSGQYLAFMEFALNMRTQALFVIVRTSNALH